MLEGYIQPIIERYTQGKFYDEVQQAKQEFFCNTGVVYEGDPFFDSRMNLFLEWYIFDREIPGKNLTPARLYYKEQIASLSPDKEPIYKGLANHIHSLFILKKRKGELSKIKDIISEEKYLVRGGDPLLKLMTEEIFEARIFPIENDWWFSNGFCFHPLESKQFITKEIRKLKTSDRATIEKFIIDLARMRLRHERYKHLDPKAIYVRGESA